MRSRWLSTFTIIGIVLIALAIVGFVLGHRFIFDPGQPSDGKEPLYYLIVGALMVLNGLITPVADEKKMGGKEGSGQARSDRSSQRKTESREAVAAADQTGSE